MGSSPWWWIPAAVTGLVAAGPLLAAAVEPPAVSAVGEAIALRRDRVAEFVAIKEAAAELGLRVWLFGGTAAGFAHYVRWDLSREAGDSRYREAFFDYDFTNIYRSTQDADLVVDGTPEQASRLEALIRQKMSFLQGSKDHWEVRLLRQDRGEKQALLNNPDFLEQHTDSNSTGMIELTDPPSGEAVVRDLRDWGEQKSPVFLQDVTHGRLHYYWSPTHQNTARFRKGDNPPLFSVIRYLVKAFQYDLKIDGEDLARIRSIIDVFDPGQDYAPLSAWAKGWLERYGPNLIRHAVNIEYAWDTLEELGLRGKLIALSRPAQEGTLGWWLSREPLRTRLVGQGEGGTAGELGIEVVAHETSDFLAYESITRDVTLRPNVLISRPGHPGETAAVGPGFYTMPGTQGARGTGLTIRFTVDPGAREGSDFTRSGGMVLFHNRAALKVIRESLDLSMPALFRMLESGLKAEHADRGIWMKLRRRLKVRGFRPGEEEEVLSIVRRAAEGEGSQPQVVLEEWFALPLSRSHPELVETMLARPSSWEPTAFGPRYPSVDRFLAERVLSQPGWSSHPELLGALVAKGTVDGLICEHLLSREEWSGHPEFVETLLGRADAGVRKCLAEKVLSSPAWAGHPELAEAWIDGYPGGNWKQDLFPLLGNPTWNTHPELVQRLIDRGGTAPLYWAAFELLKTPHWKDHPELVRALIEQYPRPRLPEEDLIALLEHPHWRGEPARALQVEILGLLTRWLERFARQSAFRSFVLGTPTVSPALGEWLTLPALAERPDLLRKLIETIPPLLDVVPWLRDGRVGGYPVKWNDKQREHIRTSITTAAERALAAVSTALKDPAWAGHPELLIRFLGATAHGRHDVAWWPTVAEVVSSPQWRDHPGLRALCQGQAPTVECLQAAAADPQSEARLSAAEVVGGMAALEGDPPSTGCR